MFRLRQLNAYQDIQAIFERHKHRDVLHLLV